MSKKGEAMEKTSEAEEGTDVQAGKGEAMEKTSEAEEGTEVQAEAEEGTEVQAEAEEGCKDAGNAACKGEKESEELAESDNEIRLSKKVKISDANKSTQPMEAPGYNDKEAVIKTGKKAESIFLKRGEEKKKKESSFLNFDNQELESRESIVKEGQVEMTGKLYYRDSEEWVLMGAGQVLLEKGVFVFIRDSLKTVLVRIPISKVRFKKQEECIIFHAPGRTSDGERTVVVEREYRLEMGMAEEFLKKVAV